MRPLAALGLAILCIAARADLVSAAWSNDPNIGNLAVCTAAGGQYSPVVVSDGAGGAIVAWSDDRGGAGYDIYAQRISATGTPLWTAGGVPLCSASGYQYGLVMVADGAGGAILAWEDGRSAVTGMDIYAQRVNAAGVAQWTSNGVAVCIATNDQYGLTIDSDGSGGAILAWMDYRSGGSDLYVQRLGAGGVPQWAANGAVLCNDANTQSSVQVVGDGAGGAIACWSDDRNLVDQDVYAQRVNAAGTPLWTTGGVPVCTQAGSQFGAHLVRDGLGGAVLAWIDGRGISYDIYAQRVDAAGALKWSFGGTAVCTAASIQYLPTLCTDGAGGAIVAWRDERSGSQELYAQRMSAGGIPVWAANGIAVCTPNGNVDYPAIVPDGAGGAVLAWHDRRYGGPTHIFAQRLTSAGNAVWPYNGAALSLAAGGEWKPMLAPDGAGGAIAVWEDFRNDPNVTDIYAQRIERFGMLGNPEPTIVKVRDVRNDQGGKVEVQWSSSYLDVVPGNPVDSYWVWRQVPTLAAQARLQRGEALAAGDGASAPPRPGALRAATTGGQVFYWEYLGSQPARGYPGYSFTAATLSDSVPGSNPYTRFMVEAQAWSGYYWSSAPDSGYSVDNLPPTPPAPVAGTYSAGVAALHWNANLEADLANYRLYRGTSAAFVPSSANLVAAPSDTAYADAAGGPFYYKLSAVDVHGNESGFTTLLPSGTSDADGSPIPRELSFAAPAPNPARGATTLRFALPREGAVRLGVYDASGRRVRELADGFRAAGEHAVTWDLCDGAGRAVSAGLYFARLEAEGRVFTRRIAATR